MRPSSQLRIRARLIVVGLAFGMLAYFGYTRRLGVEAQMWHWGHGDSISLDGYKIPVPKGWLVTDLGRRSLHMIDTTARGAWGSGVPSALAVAIGERPHPDIGAWASSERRLLQRDCVPFTVQPPVRMGMTSVVCLRKTASGPSPGQGGPVDLNCISEEGLTFGFIGSQTEVPRFYSIIAGIRHAGAASRSGGPK